MKWLNINKKTQKVLEENHTELVELRTRLGGIDADYTERINLLLAEKNKIESQLNLETSESGLLNMKHSALSNKIKIIIEQKNFLMENVESCITSLKQEWDKIKENCNNQLVVSGEKALEQHEELLILMITSFEGVKDVIKFMSFEELEIVGFQTRTHVESRTEQNVEKSIGIGELGDNKSGSDSGSLDPDSEKQESVISGVGNKNYHKINEDPRKKRLMIKSEK